MTSKGWTPNLPGLATHYARPGDAFTWCGRPARVVITTHEEDRITCKKCLKQRETRVEPRR